VTFCVFIQKSYKKIVQSKLELSLNAIHTPTNVLDRRPIGKVVKGITYVAQIHKKKLSLVKKD
jgi:hypothetical protein